MLAYEKPEANITLCCALHGTCIKIVLATGSFAPSVRLSRYSRNHLLLRMSFWYLQRQGLLFSQLWLSFGNIPTPLGQTEDDVSHHLTVASSIYFVTPVVMQWFSVMVLRTRHLSIFSRPPIFNRKTQSWLLFPAILSSLVVALVFTLAPGIGYLGCDQVPIEHWLIPMTFGIRLLSLNELRKMLVRKYLNGFFAMIA